MSLSPDVWSLLVAVALTVVLYTIGCLFGWGSSSVKVALLMLALFCFISFYSILHGDVSRYAVSGAQYKLSDIYISDGKYALPSSYVSVDGTNGFNSYVLTTFDSQIGNLKQENKDGIISIICKPKSMSFLEFLSFEGNPSFDKLYDIDFSFTQT